ncbi:MAG: ABC transporter ATP-binding protein [Candidatus Latescibacterota bacterium]|jgi:iron complex transport system ATP-binding protein
MGGVAAAVEVTGLHFGYGDQPILRDVSFRIPAGRFTVLLGRNGSGKSTLLRLLAGLMPVRQGRVTVGGRDLSGLSGPERARLVGFMPQQHRAVFPFAVEDVVLTGRASYVRLMPRREDQEKAVRALEQVGIGHLRRRRFTELSGGEQQMVMIARVLAQEPAVIMLDEPTSHLDFLNQARLLGLVRQLVGDRLTALAVLHDPNSAFLFGDHFVFLKEGRVQELGEGEHPWDRAVLERIYEAGVDTVPYGDRAIVVPLR